MNAKKVSKMHDPNPQLNINGSKVQIVQNFVYMGSQLQVNGSCDTEMRHRMTITTEVVNRLIKSILKGHD